jgi:vitamin B12 transporter
MFQSCTTIVCPTGLWRIPIHYVIKTNNFIIIIRGVPSQSPPFSERACMAQRRGLIIIFLISVISLQLFPIASPVFAQSDADEDIKFLLLYFKEEELYVEAPTRSRKAISQVAENVSVVTANEIKLMNAHTVAEVLNNVTGVQVSMTGGPGSVALATIQGSDNRHVSVYVDGVPLNNLSDNVADLGFLTVQNIEKIEIIKGPASSAWGSSLGGVINIITKSGIKGGPNGAVSASYGERNTGDFRLETSGKNSGLGYYFSAGSLQTDGFRPHNDFSGNNVYAKLTYDITNSTRVQLTTGYDWLTRGTAEIPSQDLFINNKLDTLTSTLSLKSALNKETTLDFSLWHLRQTYIFYNYRLSSNTELSNNRYVDDDYGLSAKLTYKKQRHNLVLGVDYDSKTLKSNSIAGEEHGLTKWAIFFNDTMSLGKMSVTPGIRYDHTNTYGNFTSPSLGMTYRVADATILRAYAARGFSVPPFVYTFGNNAFLTSNPDLKMENVWSYELGAETSSVKYLWLKLSGFRHEIRDAISIENVSGPYSHAVSSEKQRRQGLEIELKTVPLYHTSLTSGAAYMTTKDLTTGQTVQNVPQRTYDLGLQYDDEKSLKALLKGHYVYWNAQQNYDGKYNSYIFDLHVTKNIYTRAEQRLEIFMDVHNIFNGTQYLISIYKNPDRWVEVGIRYIF